MKWLLLVLLFGWASARAEIIELDGNCRLVGTAPRPAASIPKRRSLLASPAKPASAPVAKPKKHRKPLFKADIPPGFELECDDMPAAPSLFPPAFDAPVVPAAPPTMAVPDFPSLYIVPTVDAPTCDCFEGYYPPAPGFYGGPGGPIPGPVVGYYPTPPPAIPEPAEWLLLLAGLPFLRKRRQ